jgi:hypothetical protein
MQKERREAFFPLFFEDVTMYYFLLPLLVLPLVASCTMVEDAYAPLPSGVQVHHYYPQHRHPGYYQQARQVHSHRQTQVQGQSNNHYNSGSNSSSKVHRHNTHGQQGTVSRNQHGHDSGSRVIVETPATGPGRGSISPNEHGHS